MCRRSAFGICGSACRSRLHPMFQSQRAKEETEREQRKRRYVNLNYNIACWLPSDGQLIFYEQKSTKVFLQCGRANLSVRHLESGDSMKSVGPILCSQARPPTTTFSARTKNEYISREGEWRQGGRITYIRHVDGNGAVHAETFLAPKNLVP
jgi:hypothetical protein